MGFRDIVGALGRRWYVVLLGLVLTAGAGWYVYDANPPDYTARGLVLLLPPVGDPAEPAGSNPFLALGGLELTARVLAATYSTTSFEEELEAVSPDAEVEVSVDDSTRGGVIVVNVKDSSDQQALDTLEYVTGTVSERLVALQQEVGVADIAAVRTMMLTMDTEAKPDYQSLIRILVLVVGGGIAVTVIIALVLDVIIGRRRRRRGDLIEQSRRHRHREPDETSEDEDDAPPAGDDVDDGARRPVAGAVPLLTGDVRKPTIESAAERDSRRGGSTAPRPPLQPYTRP